jgi:hypothetical protein
MFGIYSNSFSRSAERPTACNTKFILEYHSLLNVPLKTAHNNNHKNYDRVKCLISYHKSIIIQTENDNYKIGINYYLLSNE